MFDMKTTANKLTKAQREALATPKGKTLSSTARLQLESLGLIRVWPVGWTLTDAGRAALKDSAK